MTIFDINSDRLEVYMALIKNEEIRKRLHTKIAKTNPYEETKNQKFENITSFNSLDRTNLKVDILERRILLYQTSAGEKVYMQYPGKESNREGNKYCPFDARPVLIRADGTQLPNMDFKRIWDVFDSIGENHKADIDILATIFLRMAYMIDYTHSEKEHLVETIDIPTEKIVSTDKVKFVWNYLNLDKDIIETLNDRFEINEGISLEGFLYYNDLLVQNEDCKYSYLKGNDWNKKQGRINTCLTHLTLVSYIRGKISISKLIKGFRNGVAPITQKNLPNACGDMVEF